MYKCLKCNELVDGESRICRKCGSILEEVSTAADQEEPPEPTASDIVIVAESVDEPPIIIDETRAPSSSPTTKISWICPTCSAEVPNNFEMCWQCQTTREQVNKDESDTQDTGESPEALDHEPPPIVAEAALICSKCGSDEMIPNVRIVDKNDGFSESLELVVEGNPGALIFKEPLQGRLLATICGRCGHTELRVHNPAALLAQYRTAQNRVT